MSVTKFITVVEDSVTFTLNLDDLIEMEDGEKLKTPKRDVPHSNGLKWHIQYYPAGQRIKDIGCLSVFLHVNKPVTANYTFKIDNSPIQFRYSQVFDRKGGYGPPQFASHDTLYPLFVNEQLSITCEVEFSFPTSFTSFVPRSVLYSEHVPTDFELVVDSNRVQVHKSVLSLMSPVFYAMLSHDTAESRSGQVKIVDFDFDTVKTVIDFCYSRRLDILSAETVYDMLRFADKYDIKAVTNLIENLPEDNFLIDNLTAIIRYADDFCKDDLFDKCCKSFKEHQKNIVKLPTFKQLSPLLVARLLKQTFDLKTEFDVLRHAHTNGITFILETLEQPIRESLSLDTFCDTVSYALECSRDNLIKDCGEFFNQHFTEISNMQSFVDLPPSVVKGVMKLRPSTAESITAMELKPINSQSFVCYIYYLVMTFIGKIFSLW